MALLLRKFKIRGSYQSGMLSFLLQVGISLGGYYGQEDNRGKA